MGWKIGTKLRYVEGVGWCWFEWQPLEIGFPARPYRWWLPEWVTS